MLGVIFFWPAILPGHTVSAADYLWNAAPWNGSMPSGLPIESLHPLVVGSNQKLVDGVTVFEPFLQYTGSLLPHIPLWDPFIMGGMPYLADMQSAIFSPFSLPAYVLPFWWSLGIIALAKVVVGAMGAYLLGRSLKMRPAGAFLCGLVFGFGYFMIAWIPWPLTNVFPLIPWMLLVTERLIRRPGVPWASALAALVALQYFGGHPETSVYALFATVGYFILRVLQAPGGGAAAMSLAGHEGRSRLVALYVVARRPVVALVVSLLVGTALAAVILVPFAELLRSSSDLTARPRNLVHVRPSYFFAAFLPKYFPKGFEIETGFYAGALPLMLAIIAVLRIRVERIVFAAGGVLTILVVLGIQPFFAIAGHTPGLDETYLSRLTIVYLLCVALLAGWGLDDVVRGCVRGWRARAGLGVAVGLLVLPPVIVAATGGTAIRFLGQGLHIAWLFARAPYLNAPHMLPVVRMAALVVWLTVALVAVVLLWLRLKRGRAMGPSLFVVLALVLVVGDLFQAGMGYNPTIPESHAAQPVTPAIAYLQHRRPARFAAVTPYAGTNPLPPNVNLRYGLYDLRGYDLPVVGRFGKLWTRYMAPPNPLLPLDTPSIPLTITDGLSPKTVRVLSLFGVRDVMEDAKEPILRIPGLRLVYNRSDAKLYANTGVLPRTWLVTSQHVVPSATQQLTDIVAPDFHPRQTVITGHQLGGLADVGLGGAPSGGSTTGGETTGGGTTNGPGAPAISPGAVHITRYGAERVEITARANRAAELVLSDTYYPGWKATVNGRSVPISEVDYLLRGVAVPAGTDHIVFTYDPSSFRTGWIVSLIAALCVVAALAIALLRRRSARSRGRHVRAGALGGPPPPPVLPDRPPPPPVPPPSLLG